MIFIQDFQSYQSSERRYTDEGFLIVPARIARTGIQVYKRYELNGFEDIMPLDLKAKAPNEDVRVLRPDTVVFADETLESAKAKPVTDNHPREFVTSKNAHKYAKGFIKDNIQRDDNFIKAELVIQDQDLIDKINQGIDQVSVGYTIEPLFESGFDPAFGQYDFSIQSIKINHAAIVPLGRAGSEVRLADEQHKENDMAERQVEDLAVEMSDKAAQLFDKLTAQNSELSTKVDTLQSELDEKAKLVDELQGQLDAEKAKLADALSTENLDVAVAKRLELVDRARKLKADLNPAGKNDNEIKIEAIHGVKPKFSLADKSADYVTGVFESLLEIPKETAELSDAIANQEEEISEQEKARKAFKDREQQRMKDLCGKKEKK